MTNIKCAVIGMGFISSFHIDAIRRVGFAEVVGKGAPKEEETPAEEPATEE